MDTLKGKQIMVWTFMGNARMYEALRDYGDRISQIGLFSFKVRATGEIYESGVAISDMLTYINKWPHIKWLLTVANDGANSIFRALRDNTNGAQEMFLSEIIRIMEKYPWCDGIDIDLERGDGYSTHAASTAMFQNIYNTVRKNILMPLMLDKRKPNQEYFDQIVRSLGIEDKLDSLPNQLSGGQQQRAAIARSLIYRPAILLADEPTGNLDRKNGEEIIDLLKLSNRNLDQTILLITHDEKIALEADRIITIEDGKIVSDQKRR